MRATSDLAKLYDAVLYRIKKIRKFYWSLPSRPEGDKDLVIAHCVLELDNMAICALREFTVSSLGRARTVAGHRISVNRSFHSEGEIGAYILSIINSVKYNSWNKPSSIRRNEEPTIRDPKETEKILMDCAASNLSSLQRALALNVGLFRDIATLRNFYAHRNKDTWRKVSNKARDMGVLGARHPDDLVQAIAAGRPVPVFEDWVAEAELFFEELVK